MSSVSRPKVVNNHRNGDRRNHPAEVGVAVKLNELADVLKHRLRCQGDPDCKLSGQSVAGMLALVHGMILLLRLRLKPVAALTQWSLRRSKQVV